MVKIDLITGFLGSGKTTFLKRYASYLMNQGLKIGILVNDYGAVNVDMMLLGELESEQCGLEMVAGGCDADCHRRRFKTKLIALGMSGYDRVLIEPSGIFDMDEFFDVLNEEPLSRWYEIGNVIAIVDAKLGGELSHQSRFMLASQIASAGRIVLSRVQEAQTEEIDETVAICKNALEEFQCQRDISNHFLAENWDDLGEDTFAELLACGYNKSDYVKAFQQENSGFASHYYMNNELSVSQLEAVIPQIFADERCGNVFRVKGFVQEKDGWFELNATKNEVVVKPIEKGQRILIVIGEQLCSERLDEWMNHSDS